VRVLFLTHAFPRWPGDAPGSFVHRLACALAGEGVEVRVIAPSAPGLARDEVVAGIPVRRFRYAPPRRETLAYTGTMAEEATRSWGGAVALGAFLAAEAGTTAVMARDFAPDVVHAHWWFPSALAATLAGSLARAPLVTTVHGTDARIARRAGVPQRVARAVLARSAAVTAVSSWLAGEIATAAPHGPTPVVAPMPVGTTLFTPGDGARGRQLLFVGRLNAQKGIAHAIRALAALPADVTLDVVGDGPGRRDYARLASTLGVADRIRFHGGVRQDALAPFYRAASALVMPSVDEGLGLVAVEAALCETPVVAFDSGGVRDVILHGETGLLVAARDEPALAAALDTLLADPARATAMGRAAREAALARFSPESAARKYAGIYRAVLRSRGR